MALCNASRSSYATGTYDIIARCLSGMWCGDMAGLNDPDFRLDTRRKASVFVKVAERAVVAISDTRWAFSFGPACL